MYDISEQTSKERIEELKKNAASLLEEATMYPMGTDTPLIYKGPQGTANDPKSKTEGLAKLNAMITGGSGGEGSTSTIGPEKSKDDGKKEIKEDSDVDIDSLFSEDESKILNRLIEEMEKSERNVINDIIGDEFADEESLQESEEELSESDDSETELIDDLSLEYDDDDFDLDSI